MGRDILYDCSDEWRANARETLDKVNKFLSFLESTYPDIDWEKKNGTLVSSGWRPPEVNKNTPNAAPKSKHITCQAIDIYDPDGDIDETITDELLEQFELYREHPSATKSWVHLQTVPPKSKKRTFYP